MYKAFIEPDLQTAHIKIINKFNPFSGFQNPTYILKVSQHFLGKSDFYICISHILTARFYSVSCLSQQGQ